MKTEERDKENPSRYKRVEENPSPALIRFFITRIDLDMVCACVCARARLSRQHFISCSLYFPLPILFLSLFR